MSYEGADRVKGRGRWGGGRREKRGREEGEGRKKGREAAPEGRRETKGRERGGKGAGGGRGLPPVHPLSYGLGTPPLGNDVKLKGGGSGLDVLLQCIYLHLVTLKYILPKRKILAIQAVFSNTKLCQKTNNEDAQIHFYWASSIRFPAK